MNHIIDEQLEKRYLKVLQYPSHINDLKNIQKEKLLDYIYLKLITLEDALNEIEHSGEKYNDKGEYTLLYSDKLNEMHIVKNLKVIIEKNLFGGGKEIECFSEFHLINWLRDKRNYDEVYRIIEEYKSETTPKYYDSDIKRYYSAALKHLKDNGILNKKTIQKKHFPKIALETWKVDISGQINNIKKNAGEYVFPKLKQSLNHIK